MYTRLWHLLPGSTGLKIAQLIVLGGAVLWLLLYVVFPAIEHHLPLDQVHVG